jgi:hypothetical protein
LTEPRTERDKLRSFALLTGGIFTAFGLWPALFRHQSPRLWVLVAASLLFGLGVLCPQRLRLVYRIWMAIGHALGWINTRIILGAMFYGFITPMGLILRWMAKDPMQRGFEKNTNTYRVLRQPRPSSHMRRQF